ncbi:unnamed protein product [Urochloa decumbens]|uniref:Knottins-like domain-containing protein n=1 Tax=Urochloa decumbens TaxID=240449 RepID=A0ABC9B5M6_9POAL
MAPSSRKNVSAAVAVVLLLLIIITAGNAEMAAVEGAICSHMSATYLGLCWTSKGCDITCRNEDWNSYGGKCDNDFPPHCICYKKCPPWHC